MRRLPPGPSGKNPLNLLRMMLDPHDTYARLTRAYGDPFTVSTVIGPMVVTSDPEGVRDFFTADPEGFEYCAPEMEGPLLGDSSLVFAPGHRHVIERKLMSPAFHTDQVRRYAGAALQATMREVTPWKVGETFDIHRSAQTISLEVLVRALFGFDDIARIQAFREAVLGLVEALTPVLILFTGLRRRFGGFGPYARFLRASERLDALVYEEIAARRGDGSPREDILTRLVDARSEGGEKMSDKKLRDEIRVLLFAGHETTAVAIAWAMYQIHRAPAVRERLIAELDQAGDAAELDALSSLPYLDAVCQETLRVSTIVPEIARKLTKPLRLKGFELPAGVSVLAAASLLHEREDLYPDAQDFRPERFLDRKPSPYEFIPFGGGAHRCLGASLAVLEMKVALAALLRRFDLRLASERPIRSERRGLTMGPKGGVPMVLVDRRGG